MKLKDLIRLEEGKSVDNVFYQSGRDIKVYPNVTDLKKIKELADYSNVENFNASSTRLTSLEGAPTQTGRDFTCYDCKGLTSLEGGPTSVGTTYSAWGCKLTSYIGVATTIGVWLTLWKNPIPDLKDIHKYFKQGKMESATFPSEVKSHMLGTALIPGLELILVQKAQETENPKYCEASMIINRYLPGKPDVMEIHEALTRAGLKEYAKL